MNNLDTRFISIEQAVALLKEGAVCAFPTETVYGLGADARNPEAVLRIFETKGRPQFNPLIVHCADLAMAREIAEFSPVAERLAGLWPGPLTLVLPLKSGGGIADLVTAGLGTVGVRVPAHPGAQALIRAFGGPLAAPSANRSGELSATDGAQVRKGLGAAVPVIDGGTCSAGLESTILSVVEGRVVQLRAGAMARGDIEAALNLSIEMVGAGAAVQAPGMLASHYAPRAALRLDADGPEAGEAWLGFGAEPEPETQGAGARRNLSPSGDLREAAHNFFRYLHELDASGAAVIAVAVVPATGLGEAINDRLERAAAPRG